MLKKLLVAVLFLVAVCSAQVAVYQPHVAILGNSIAMFEAGLQRQIFPQLNPASVYIMGHHPSYTCGMVRLMIPFDAFGTSLAPRNPDVVVLVNDTTNDVQHGTTPGDIFTCLQHTVSDLLSRKPTLKVVVLTTPPWTQFNPCTSTNNDPSISGLIQSYNAVLPGLQSEWPHNVRVLDAWTPFLDEQRDGWANPALMGGPCGIHPGTPYTWDFGQPTLAAIYRNTVMRSNLPW